MQGDRRARTGLSRYLPLQEPSSNPKASLLMNTATGRCLSNGTAMGFATAVLLPCNSSDPLQVSEPGVGQTAVACDWPLSFRQAWLFPAGLHTVTAVVNAASGLALAFANSTLFTGSHGGDAPGPDASCALLLGGAGVVGEPSA